MSGAEEGENKQGTTDRRESWRRQRQEQVLTREETLKRNYVERIKKEKLPYDLEPALEKVTHIPYEEVPEEDMLRLQWFGLYHDRPKVGQMMLRVKVPGGLLTPAQLRLVGELSVRFGGNQGEITTRQDLQLHGIRLDAVPEIFGLLQQVGLSTKGGCGDVLRNITSCPAAGIDAEELFDVSAVVHEAHRGFSGNPHYGDLPRKHKWTIAACPYHCNGPAIHDVALVGTLLQGRPGFAVWVGGGLSIAPRLASPLGVFVPPEDALEVARAVLEIWQVQLKYRLSRVKARFKFMVEDYGPQKIREMIEQHLGRCLITLEQEPRPVGRSAHLGIHRQKQPGLCYIGLPVCPGLLTGQQMMGLADIAQSVAAEIRLTPQQNLILAGVPEAQVDGVVARLGNEAGLRLDLNAIRGLSIACTGEPHCNFSIGDTKRTLVELVEHLEQKFGQAAGELQIHLDGCPHACGQHWVADIGIQGTTLMTQAGKAQAHDIFLRGGLGTEASIARPVFRRVPAEHLKGHVEKLFQAYLQHRRPGETIQQFFARHTDDEVVGWVSPAPASPTQK